MAAFLYIFPCIKSIDQVNLLKDGEFDWYFAGLIAPDLQPTLKVV